MATWIICRHFRTRAGRQSFGIGMRKPDIETRSTDFYKDNKMQKLWSNAFERISSSQSSMPQQSHHSSGFGSASTDSANDRLRHISGADKLINLTNDEQNRMKLSFAEGYLYGQENIKKPIRIRLVTFLKEGLTIVILGAVAYSVLSSGGPFKRVLMGQSSYEVRPEEIDVTFSDVKGCDEAKQELNDIVEFLREPTKYSRLGGKLPKGVLLVGPPGTGKTLLARAVAGEAGVPFFQASGSEFDEILVGQGARRVRELFETAKSRTPCVIFIDEIDSVGGKRTNSVLHPYANQTINQLLSEMDGFNQNEGVIVMGATNRADDLDKALLRPGRFDVRVRVPVPDYKGRKELFEHYLSKIKCSSDVDVDTLCRTTIGFTGADIENLVNQGALKAATDNLDIVTLDSLEFARDKIMMGPERKNRIPDEEQNLMTAYHEGGHALVAFYTERANDLHKVTIVSRGESLGHTSTLPEKDMYSQTREQLAAAMDVMLGGRVAEELIYGSDKVTTGCSDDLRKASALASTMVKELGMSEKIGMRVFPDDQGGSPIVVNDVSQSTSELVDAEINRLLEESYNRAKDILTSHKRELKLLADALLKYETLDAAEVKLIVEGKDIKTKPDKEKDRKGKSSNIKLTNPDRLPLDLLK